MTWDEASAYAGAINGRKQLLDGPGDMWTKAQQLNQLDQLADKPAPTPKEMTLGTVLRGAIGSAFGLGVSRGVGNMLGVSDSTQSKIDNVGMTLSGMYNSGFFKNSQELNAADNERRHAFRLGFMKGAIDSGLMKKSMVALTPELITGPIKLVGNTVNSAFGVAGSTLGALDSPDADDEDITKLQVEREMLRSQVEKAEAERRTRALKRILANRIG